ncbi:MAG: 30S ribosomal protein S5 [Patescibacteria group bacterium]|nr:30S ribosomal protein S5 [Patescibacteria group bacterium]
MAFKGNFEKRSKEFEETVVEIKRVSKKTKGGNQISFTALMVVGDGKGKVGVGLGKSKNVPSAIKKGIDKAKKKMIMVKLKGRTIPRPIDYRKKSAHILLKPAREGSGLIAGGAIRVIASAAGIKDLVAKIIGTRNKAMNVWITWEALKDSP